MIALIDTIFAPLLGWLMDIRSNISELSVPLARPINIGSYMGPFALLGPYWITFITTSAFLAFVYVVAFIIMASNGLFIKFKDSVKWW